MRRRVGLGCLIALVLGIVGGTTFCWAWMIRMPGDSFEGELPALTDDERALTAELRRDVTTLGSVEHNVDHHAALETAADWVEAQLTEAGFTPERQTFQTRGLPCHNFEAVLEGTDAANESVVVGAHYDSAPTAPGANDNASGTAALLALARRFAGEPRPRTIRFVAFTNEEPPWFQTEHMGSLVYARSLAENDIDVVAMLSIETIGYYSDEDGSQAYPAPLSLFYPSRGDFIGFVSDTGNRDFLHRVVTSFRSHTDFPSNGGALPGDLPGIDWSDHWSFWQAGYPGVMVTDTAPFRYPHYHTPEDTPDKLDYERTARVVAGLFRVVDELADPSNE